MIRLRTAYLLTSARIGYLEMIIRDAPLNECNIELLRRYIKVNNKLKSLIGRRQKPRK